uniref:Uncharacterized protein n=1 Tax=Anguilla anguilla TaxID=7936 RepID=A0A0E9P651_ANGAN
MQLAALFGIGRIHVNGFVRKIKIQIDKTFVYHEG